VTGEVLVAMLAAGAVLLVLGSLVCFALVAVPAMIIVGLIKLVEFAMELFS